MEWLLAFVLVTAQSAQPPEQIIVFAVSTESEDSRVVTLDPVVILLGTAPQGQRIIRAFADPVPPRDSPAAHADYERTFLAEGAEYTTFHGGERLGKIRLGRYRILGGDGGCQDLAGGGTLVSGPGNGLAVSYDVLKSHPKRQRTASAKEREHFLDAARKWLRDYGLDPGLVSRASLAEIVATELRATEPALLGRVDLKATSAEHHLFLLVEKGTPNASWAILDTKQDLQDGTDESLRTFVDQIDFDGDGVDEVVLKTQHYESWDYSILASTGRGGWYRAFTGGGGGC